MKKHISALNAAEQKHADAHERLENLRVERANLEQHLRELASQVQERLWQAGRAGKMPDVDALRSEEQRTRQRIGDLAVLERGAEAAVREAFTHVQTTMASDYNAHAGDLRQRGRELVAEHDELAARQAELNEQIRRHGAAWERLEIARTGDPRLGHLKRDLHTGDIRLDQNLEPITFVPDALGATA